MRTGHKLPAFGDAVDTLLRVAVVVDTMEVEVSIAGGEAVTVSGDGRRYGDLVEAVGLSRKEAAVLVNGRPVPLDAAVDASEVTILRLIHGG